MFMGNFCEFCGAKLENNVSCTCREAATALEDEKITLQNVSDIQNVTPMPPQQYWLGFRHLKLCRLFRDGFLFLMTLFLLEAVFLIKRRIFLCYFHLRCFYSRL